MRFASLAGRTLRGPGLVVVLSLLVLGCAQHSQRAAERGNAIAQYNLGVAYDHGRGVSQDFWQAAHWYREAAEQDYSPAQNNLGVLYENGQGVPQDFEQAAHWYRKAAEQGLAAAQYTLGLMCESGQGVPQDFEQAAHWYRKAAERRFSSAPSSLGARYYEEGLAPAQTKLCVLYGEGLGVPQDFDQALHWCRKAAEQGYFVAIAAVKRLDREVQSPSKQ